MTAGDIPDWTGQPDQGFEGFRFVGWSLYDSFINWDLSRSDVEAPLRPGLATKWTIDPARFGKPVAPASPVVAPAKIVR